MWQPAFEMERSGVFEENHDVHLTNRMAIASIHSREVDAGHIVERQQSGSEDAYRPV